MTTQRFRGIVLLLVALSTHSKREVLVTPGGAFAEVAAAAHLLKQGQGLLATLGPAGARQASAAFDEALDLEFIPRRARVAILEEAAFVRSILKQPRRALEARREAWKLQMREDKGKRNLGVSEKIVSHIEIARLELEDGQYTASIESIARVKKIIAAHMSNEVTSNTEGLLRLESEALECAGNAVAALRSFERALRMGSSRLNEDEAQGNATPLEFTHSKDLTRLVFLVKRATARDAAFQTETNASLTEYLHEVTSELLSRGPWRNPQQLPVDFLPHLKSQPWQRVEDFQQLDSVVKILESHSEALRTDLHTIQQKGLLLPEDECIREESRGTWGWFSTKGHWLEHRDEDGCSLDTPGACHLLKELGAYPRLEILRGSFSVLGPGAHLQAHCGPTNARLKFHLALEAPVTALTGEPCARMRVGNETRAW